MIERHLKSVFDFHACGAFRVSDEARQGAVCSPLKAQDVQITADLPVAKSNGKPWLRDHKCVTCSKQLDALQKAVIVGDPPALFE